MPHFDGIVSVSGPILLLGGAPVDNLAISELLATLPNLFAADGGGARAALDAGYCPRAVIGDMDSLDAATREALLAGGADLIEVAEQESTDFEKCLQRLRAPLIYGAGFTGARLDHTLAAFTALVRHADQRVILVGEEDVIFLSPAEIELDVPAGTRVSLYPMGAVRGRSDGLHWPIDGIDFAPNGRIGTSNRAMGPVRLSFDTARMLVIMPRAALDAVAQALLAAPGK
ncbi:thiamine diphosphokinase [Pseudoruegeria sp. SHC-113]|uniref:thiamine diphosphokinase n=1 Tax=Pseudoruegeria sp. SHC-113 TaxID=2855439 RepID=UPI0021BA9699|nr:thiamine diphosphokinase [Pseudoruegeria sp. SHC-113]MCT8159807.1 thiamine diphosphokinase [Pseudoruegeria sp. SHC-113]